jgi:hypothetical protein
MWYTRNIYIYLFINWTLRMSDNLPERVKILCPAHIICITVLENRIICCQVLCDLLLKFAFEQIFNVMHLILVKIKWHIKWKYLIQKFHDIGLSYYFNSDQWGTSSKINIFNVIHTAHNMYLLEVPENRLTRWPCLINNLLFRWLINTNTLW